MMGLSDAKKTPLSTYSLRRGDDGRSIPDGVAPKSIDNKLTHATTVSTVLGIDMVVVT